MITKEQKNKLSSWISEPAAWWQKNPSAETSQKVVGLNFGGEPVDITNGAADLDPAPYQKVYAEFLKDELSKNEYHPDQINSTGGPLENAEEKSFRHHTRGDTLKSVADIDAFMKTAGGQPESNVLSKINSDANSNNLPYYSKVLTQGTEPVSKILMEIEGTPPVPTPGESQNYQDSTDKRILSMVEYLKEKNIYSPNQDSPFFLGGEKSEEEITRGLFTIQRELGEFLKSPGEKLRSGASQKDPASGQRVKVSDMAALAMSLLANSAGDNNTASKIALGSNIDSGISNAAIREFLGQSAINGVDISKLQLNGIVTDDGERKNIINAARGNKEFISPQELGGKLFLRGMPATSGDNSFVSTPYNSISHGQLNTFLEPFGEGFLSSIGMLTIAVTDMVILLAAGFIIEALSNIPDASKPGTQKNNSLFDTKSPNGMALGRHDKVDKFATILDFVLRDMLRIPKTDYNFGDAVGGGICLMLGLPGNLISRKSTSLTLSDMSQLQAFAINLLTTPGYYANYVRQLVMSSHQAIAAFAKLGSSSPTFAAESFFPAVQKLANSKIYQFFMIAAMVGDANLKSFFGQRGVGDKDRLYQLKAAGVDLIDPDKFVRTKITLNENGIIDKVNNSLGSSEFSSNYAALAGLRDNLFRWGGGKNTLSLTTYIHSEAEDPTTSYTSPFMQLADRSTVSSIEEALEAEYVPFYFHDLRTQEIISMPAFLTDFSDSFAASYNTTNAYGRQDPVAIYSNTERSISFGFKLVSFNSDDFDRMWHIVNKLVAMCYPQYSAGALRTANFNGRTVNFEQPFSQVPAASPMIRVRVGDVYKSNFSNKSLQKLFGVGTDRFKVESEEDFSKKLEEKRNNLYKKKVSDLNKLDKDDLERISFSRIRYGINKTYKTPASGDASSVTVNSTNLFILKLAYEVDGSNNTLTGNFDGYIDASDKDVAQKCFFSDVPIDDLELDTRIPSAKYDGKIMNYVISKNPDLAPKENISSAEDIKKQFFDSGNNAIVRSFESTRGKGLAGFITSLQFDYKEANWRTDIPGSKAPMIITVSVQFRPIHDLPLGLDSDGRLRSPSHPVGKTMSQHMDETKNPSSETYNKVLENLNDAVKIGKGVPSFSVEPTK